MARKSASSFDVVPIEQVLPKIEPPAHLNAAEKSLFHSLVASCPPGHFQKCDAQLLSCYVQACCLAALAYESALASPSHMGNWVKATKAMVTLGRQLRLAPISRTDPRSLARAYAGRFYNQPGVSLEDLSAARAGTGLRDWKARG